jgi:hypothetical protein
LLKEPFAQDLKIGTYVRITTRELEVGVADVSVSDNEAREAAQLDRRDIWYLPRSGCGFALDNQASPGERERKTSTIKQTAKLREWNGVGALWPSAPSARSPPRQA